MIMKPSFCLTYSLYRCLKSCLIMRPHPSSTSHSIRCLHVLHSRQSLPPVLTSTSGPAVNPHVVRMTCRTFRNHRQHQYRIVHPGKVSPTRVVPDHIEKPCYVVSRTQFKRPDHVEIKSENQITGMRSACMLARKILDHAGQQLRVGMTTDEIDELVHEMSIKNNAYPSPLLYRGFSKSVCTSVNNVLCHGIPDNSRLEDGDIINIDITVFYHGFHGDVSETFLIGSVDEGGRRLVATARKCRDAGVEVCHPGARLCDIGNAINETAEMCGYAVVPVFCGHGIGEYFHGPPDIFHIAYEDDEVMKPGMTFTIEPIISEGSTDIKILDDGWTAITVDDSRSAQFEHTVLITERGVQVLTTDTPS
ncbi:methionine aminopeptidase 1D, mitochondrial-like [Gigantopelta aegis]|uniref:methionine aminopeptidase 1D, mitochondrial-like n=1 Tax=Gigantopelta aegis TaxID=1735272 RepID=UPI001B88DAB3|nr:methionine aminopeptidase 1D, mitochondrial-like [Gigantopelta aegis]